MNKNVWQTLDSYLCMQEEFGKGQWSFHWSLVQRRIDILSVQDSPQGDLGQNGREDDVRVRRKRMFHFSMLLVHCPEII